MFRKILIALTALLVLALGAVGTAAAAGQRPETFTARDSFTEVFNDEVCNGEFVDITIEWSAVFHITEFADGRYHVTGTLVGDFSWTTAAGVTYSGQVTQWFGENGNGKSQNGTFTINGEGWGSDGSRVQVMGLGQYTVNANGELTVGIERFSITCS